MDREPRSAGPDEVVISGLGLVTPAGEGPELLARLASDDASASPGPAPVEVEPGVTVLAGRLGRLHRHPLRARHERMAQLDAFSQYAFIAAVHAFDDAGVTVPAPDQEDVGVVLGTAFGCQEANLQFDQFELAGDAGGGGSPVGVRPAVFKATVDNVPAGWLAVGLGLRGLNATFTSGSGAGAEAVVAAAWAIERGRALRVVAGGVDRVVTMQLAARRRARALPEPWPGEGAAMVVLEAAGAAAARGHAPRARLLGAARLAGDDLGPWASAAIRGGHVALTSVVAPTRAAREQQRLALERAGAAAGRTLAESETTGDLFAAQGPLALALLVARLQRLAAASPEPPLGLLCADGEGDEVFALLVEAEPVTT